MNLSIIFIICSKTIMFSRTILEELISIKQDIESGNVKKGLKSCWIALGERETLCNIQARKIEEMEEEIKRLRAYLERNDKI